MPPRTLAEAFVSSIGIDVGKLATAGNQPWAGLAWPAAESPFGPEPMRNFAWKPSAPLFPNSEITWKRRQPVPDSALFNIEVVPGPLTAQDKVKWEAGKSPFSRLVLIDRAGSPVEVPLRWGKDASTGE